MAEATAAAATKKHPLRAKSSSGPLRPPRPFDVRARGHARLKRGLEPYWLFVLLQKIGESRAGQLLEVLTCLTGYRSNGLPRLIELNALSYHCFS